MANLLDRASVVLTPTAYNNGEALCIKPDDASGDFQFSRNSAATRVNAQGLVENVQILSSNLVQNGDFSEEGVQEVSNGSFSQEGVQLVTNGDFSNGSANWNLGASWSIVNEKAVNNGASNSFLTQNSIIENGKSYLVSFEISNMTQGSLQLRFGSGAIVTESFTTNGTKTSYYVSSGNAINFYSVSGFDGSIDNCSVREVGQNWVLGTGWSIAEDKAIFNSSLGTSNIISSTLNITNGKFYKLNFNVVSGTARLAFTTEGSQALFKPNGNGANNFSVGEYSFYLVAENSASALKIFAYNVAGGQDCSITNISVKEVGMDWDLQTGWEIGEDKATFDKTIGGAGNINQNNILAAGKNYKLTFDTLETNGGNIAYRFGGGYTFISAIQANTTHTVYGVGGGAQFTLRGADNFIGSITNISVIEITDDTNLPRINYEGFSYQDDLGSEEIVNGDFSNGSTGWAIEAVWTIGGGVANGNGANSSTEELKQYDVLTIGKRYKSVYEIKNFISGTVGIVDGQQYSNNGVYIEYFTAVSTLYRFRPTNFIGSIDNVSVKEYLGQEVVPNSGCGSWLFEPQSTNLVTYSEDFSDASWTQTGTSTLGANAGTSPSGSLDAYSLIPEILDERHVIRDAFTATSLDATGSLFVKPNGYNHISVSMIYSANSAGAGVIVDLTDGSVYASKTQSGASFSVKVDDYADGWKRVSLNITQSANAPDRFAFGAFDGGAVVWNAGLICPIFAGNGTDGVLIYGAQVEELSYATSYIPTAGSSVTRNQDLCNNGATGAGLINSTEGVLYAEIKKDKGSQYSLVSLQKSGQTNTYAYIGFLNNNTQIKTEVKVNGVSAFQSTQTFTDTNTYFKIALKFKSGDYALWINGLEKSTGTNATIFSSDSLDSLEFGNHNNSIFRFFGNVKALALWKEALTDSELTELTTI